MKLSDKVLDLIGRGRWSNAATPCCGSLSELSEEIPRESGPPLPRRMALAKLKMGDPSASCANFSSAACALVS